jgi:hypothetical protein
MKRFALLFGVLMLSIPAIGCGSGSSAQSPEPATPQPAAAVVTTKANGVGAKHTRTLPNPGNPAAKPNR